MQTKINEIEEGKSKKKCEMVVLRFTLLDEMLDAAAQHFEFSVRLLSKGGQLVTKQ